MKLINFLFSSILIFAINLSAQSTNREMTKSSLKAIGAPNNPKVEIAWNRYYDWKEIEDICRRLTDAYSDLILYSSIGKSEQDRAIHLLTVSNFKNGDVNRKPAIYIDGNIHSNEIQGAEVSLYTAWFLAENYGKVQWITGLLDNKTFYIVPTINPDARDHYIHQPNTPHSPRSGMKPRDDDGDGLFDEDGFDDLDGDGNIVMMRRKNPIGRWKEDPKDPRLMVQAEPDEMGGYDLIGWEGIDNDGDGRVNEDGPGFYDPNRNWGWQWQPAYVQYGSDQYPFSLPETRAVADFVLAHPNIGAAQSYHNSGGMILRGPGTERDLATYNKQDIQKYEFLGKLGEEMLPGYRYMVLYKDLYPAVGGELDWFYGGRGIYTFTNELWSSFDYFRNVDKKDQSWFGRRADVYRFDRLLLFGEGIVPWKKIKHPQYGEIEIGGIKKAWTRTAPSFLIEDMCHRNMAFTLFHAYHLPVLKINSQKVKDLPGGLKQIDVVIFNERVLPTRSAHEVTNKITPPDIISISGKNLKVIGGFLVEDPYLNIVREQKYNPENLRIDTIDGMSEIHLRWIVSGDYPFKITIDSNKGGLVQSTLRSSK
ncbi:MAG: M14 family metallopeptidase [Calditrichia bacterium]